jgi:hypothetical protein
MDWLNKSESYADNKMKDLSGMNFPASKDEVVSYAKSKHLPPDVISRLERLPDKTYDNVAEMVVAAAKGSKD